MTRPHHLALTQLLRDTGSFLGEHRGLWAERAFVGDEVHLERAHPELARWLLALSSERVRRYEREPHRLREDAPAPLDRWLELARVVERVAVFVNSAAPPALPPRLRWEVPARKQQQVMRFIKALERTGVLAETRGEVVDWCAGKGYLGRALAARGAQVTYVEQVGERCVAGRRLDRRARTNGRWLTADAHDPRAHQTLEGRLAVALHACGELHRELVERGVERGASALAFAPCCYHREHRRRQTEPAGQSAERRWVLAVPRPPARWHYQPLSRRGRDAVEAGLAPRLDEHALRLATASQQVARPRVIALRDRERAFRLALDPLLREATGEDRYLSLPPLPTAWLRLDFEGFVARLGQELSLPLHCADTAAAEARGWRRLHRVRALGLVRGLFRRSIELWLAADTGRLLEERGYEVHLGTFCPPRITPRNLLIVASRR